MHLASRRRGWKRVTDRLPMAAVVIGRNEGERLAPSLRSVLNAGLPVVYADSGSTDRSCEVAREFGIAVVELDPSRPFSAARGRNEGLDEARRRWPQIDYVMFLDGDCVLDPSFPAAAVALFGERAECAVVTGHLSERHADASIYNRLCAIEWRSPSGPIAPDRLGGIMAVRVSAFCAVNGFNEQAIAGEEPDFAARLTLAGWSLLKLDRPMATHDAHMLRFGQWWRRAVRSGHAMAHGYALDGGSGSREGRRAVRSALFWGFALPLAIVLFLVPTRGLSMLLLACYGWLGLRVYRYYRGEGLDRSDAWLASRFIIYAKVPELIGILRYGLNRLRGQFHIIEWR
jgi:glycosyltransferase involved in cell wall biosynthesis